MSTHLSHRRAGAVTLGAGLAFVVAQLAVFLALDRDGFPASLGTGAYRAAAVGMLLAFAGLLAAAVVLHGCTAHRTGTFGVVGVSTAALGTLLMAGDWWFETFAVAWYAEVAPATLDIPGSGWLAVGGITSYLTFALGWALFGVALLRSRSYPRVVCAALVLGGLVGYGAVLPPYGIPLGLALTWLGAVVWRQSEEATAVLAGARR